MAKKKVLKEKKQVVRKKKVIKKKKSVNKKKALKKKTSVKKKSAAKRAISKLSGFTTAKVLSGAAWCAQFPGSKLISDLATPFKENVQSFYDALIAAGATVDIDATYRPKKRAFLMRTSYDIAKGNIKPEDAGTLEGVDIEWVHPTPKASIDAAKAMVSGYGIRYKPAYPTNHSDKTAIDMNVTWTGDLTIKKKDGTSTTIKSTPKDNGNTDLHAVGLTYGVRKLVVDAPHWSASGT